MGMDKTDKYKVMINKAGSAKIVIFMTFLVLDCGYKRYIKVKSPDHHRSFRLNVNAHLYKTYLVNNPFHMNKYSDTYRDINLVDNVMP